MDAALTKRTIEELQLIRYSLLPGEHLVFIKDTQEWADAMSRYDEDPSISTFPSLHDMPRIEIYVDEVNIRFELTPGKDGSLASVSIKGDDITRKDQERWLSSVTTKMSEISDSEFPIYQLISLHVLPLLHEEIRQSHSFECHSPDATNIAHKIDETYHVLFTSHHLLSAAKRRSLQSWSGSLQLSGFAKVGHPGVIYAQGTQGSIEEFVDNVKAMQWLALKVRFVEPLPISPTQEQTPSSRSWKEFQKVGEVVDEMRRLGREEYVVEMGIGSAGVNSK